jgi:hypothetical protein
VRRVFGFGLLLGRPRRLGVESVALWAMAEVKNDCLNRPASQNFTAVVPLTDFFRCKRMILREK